MKALTGITYVSLRECIQYTSHYLSNEECSTLIIDLTASDILTETQKTELVNLLPSQKVYTNNSDYLLNESFVDNLDVPYEYIESGEYTYDFYYN
jgi:hypothetical protein